MNESRAPLAGRRVWLARAAGRGAGLAERLRTLGADVDVQPAISFDPPVDEARAVEAAARITCYHWLLFTSPTGVRCFARRLAASGTRPDQVRARVAVVGPGTDHEAREAGWTPEVVARRAHAGGLADALAGRIVPGARLLLVRPEVAPEALARALEERGAAVDSVPFYRTVPAPGSELAAAVLARGGYDAVVFGSPSAVRVAWGEAARGAARWERARVIAIGPVTAAMLEALGRKPDATAAEPSDGAVSRAVLEAFAAPR